MLLIEAGGSAPRLVHIPGLVGNLQRGVLDWAFKTEEQPWAGRSGGGVSRWPRGRVLGGSSLLNYMLYVRGNSRDYDEWGALGLDGWSWEEVLPFFKRTEKWRGEDDVGQEHGEDGDLWVEESRHTDAVVEAFLESGPQLQLQLHIILSTGTFPLKGSRNCGASSGADFIQIYFLRMRMFR